MISRRNLAAVIHSVDEWWVIFQTELKAIPTFI